MRSRKAGRLLWVVLYGNGLFYHKHDSQQEFKLAHNLHASPNLSPAGPAVHICLSMTTAAFFGYGGLAVEKSWQQVIRPLVAGCSEGWSDCDTRGLK